MPPWVASVPRSTTCLRRIVIDRLSPSLRCRDVSASNLRIRSASTHVSPTAINYRPNIPPRNEELYNALSALSGAAERFVNLSRLQLALRGLAAENAVTRVAVLGLNSQVSARKLARLLVADPLGKEAAWEVDLEKHDEYGKAVLLRFGDETDAHSPNPLYRTLSVPSRLLDTHNLEILVSTLNVQVANTITPSASESSQDSVLVPKLQTTLARGLPVPYPVHMTLILGEGLESAIAFGKFTSDSLETTGEMVKVAIDLPPLSRAMETSIDGTCTPVNIEVGTEGLAALRASVANSITYERNWFASNLPTLSKWLTHNLQPTSPIKPAHTALISSLLDDVETSITLADTQQLAKITSSIPQDQTAAEMVANLEQWAEKAHEELRDSLGETFEGKNWRKIAWWKLFWRVDDVGMVLEEVLERRWLVDAEKSAVYLAGRMKQAGFPEDLQGTAVEFSEASQTITAAGESSHSPPPTGQQPSQTDLSTDVKPNIPWPSLISSTRAALLTTTLPPLHALAQRLILTTLSTTSLSTALSALLYVSMPSLSLFEAGAVAALGLTLSLRRMQKVWEGARETWQARVREEGRQTLKGTEEVVRLVVKGKKSGEGVDGEGIEERRLAREAVGKVREALERMER